eukprot:6634339-Prymnesium_polylepis.1
MAGLPRAQVPAGRGAAPARSHLRHDGRRRQRRASAQEGRRARPSPAPLLGLSPQPHFRAQEERRRHTLLGRSPHPRAI